MSLSGQSNLLSVVQIHPPQPTNLLNHHAFALCEGFLLCQVGHIWTQHFTQLFGDQSVIFPQRRECRCQAGGSIRGACPNRSWRSSHNQNRQEGTPTSFFRAAPPDSTPKALAGLWVACRRHHKTRWRDRWPQLIPCPSRITELARIGTRLETRSVRNSIGTSVRIKHLFSRELERILRVASLPARSGPRSTTPILPQARWSESADAYFYGNVWLHACSWPSHNNQRARTPGRAEDGPTCLPF